MPDTSYASVLLQDVSVHNLVIFHMPREETMIQNI